MIITQEEKDSLEQLLKDFEKELEVRGIEKKIKARVNKEGILIMEVLGGADWVAKVAEVMLEFTKKNSNRIPKNLRAFLETSPAVYLPSVNFRKKNSRKFKRIRICQKF